MEIILFEFKDCVIEIVLKTMVDLHSLVWGNINRFDSVEFNFEVEVWVVFDDNWRHNNCISVIQFIVLD